MEQFYYINILINQCEKNYYTEYNAENIKCIIK